MPHLSNPSAPRKRLPNRRLCRTFNIEFAGLRYKVSIGHFANGSPIARAISRNSDGSPSGVIGAVLDVIASDGGEQ
jgi:hypothetical protein